LERGRENPIYIYNLLSYSGRRKLEGFRRAAAEFGLTGDRCFFIPHSPREVAAVSELLSLRGFGSLEFDSAVCSEDLLAVGVVRFALSKGLRVPEDICVSGYNNSAVSEYYEPTLTSVDNKLSLLCERSVRTLVEFLAGSDVPKTQIFSSEIIERRTSMDL